MPTEETVIKMEGVHKSYYLANGKPIHVLKGIDLNIKQGEFVAIMGESGGGKSTLLNIIGCLHPLNSGNYYLNGENIGSLKDDFALSYIRNKKMGFIFQQFNLLTKQSALKNVALPGLYSGMGTEEREERAAKLLTDVGLGKRLHHRPNELSGGQQQRVAIARALMNDPDIILADEPTGALDSVTSQEVMDIFEGVTGKKKTVVMVTHSQKGAEHAGRVIFLRDGIVIDNDYKFE